MKGLKEDFGFYSGMQEAFGAPSHFRLHRDPTWQHTNKLLRHVLSPGSPSSIACLLCYSIYLFLNPELKLLNISHCLKQNKILGPIIVRELESIQSESLKKTDCTNQLGNIVELSPGTNYKGVDRV